MQTHTKSPPQQILTVRVVHSKNHHVCSVPENSLFPTSHGFGSLVKKSLSSVLLLFLLFLARVTSLYRV